MYQNPRDLSAKVFERLSTFNVQTIMPALRHCNTGAREDILNTNGCCYYQWLTCLVDVVKPKQILELGGAMGVSALMMLQTLPSDSLLYSITLPEGGLEFSFIKEKYKNFVPVLGDDLDLSNWPKDLDLGKTDIWFFDTEHTRSQLTKELFLYSRFFKDSAILLFDDIRMEELRPVWDMLPYSKIELTNPLHYSGFGMAIV